MGIHHGKTAIHWNYFLALEEDLLRLARFAEPAEDNLDAYSIEIARLFLAACSEIDVVLKQLCERLNPRAPRDNIGDYRKAINEVLPEFSSFQVTANRYGQTFEPWINWKSDESPDWWRAHNDVKHHRHEAFNRANLRNALNSLAALFVATLYLYEKQASEAKLIPMAQVLGVKGPAMGGTDIGAHGVSVRYVLPMPTERPATPVEGRSAGARRKRAKQKAREA